MIMKNTKRYEKIHQLIHTNKHRKIWPDLFSRRFQQIIIENQSSNLHDLQLINNTQCKNKSKLIDLKIISKSTTYPSPFYKCYLPVFIRLLSQITELLGFSQLIQSIRTIRIRSIGYPLLRNLTHQNNLFSDVIIINKNYPHFDRAQDSYPGWLASRGHNYPAVQIKHLHLIWPSTWFFCSPSCSGPLLFLLSSYQSWDDFGFHLGFCFLQKFDPNQDSSLVCAVTRFWCPHETPHASLTLTATRIHHCHVTGTAG